MVRVQTEPEIVCYLRTEPPHLSAAEAANDHAGGSYSSSVPYSTDDCPRAQYHGDGAPEYRHFLRMERQREAEQRAAQVQKAEKDKLDKEFLKGRFDIMLGGIRAYYGYFPGLERGIVEGALFGTANSLALLVRDLMNIAPYAGGVKLPAETFHKIDLILTGKIERKLDESLWNVATTALVPPPLQSFLCITQEMMELTQKLQKVPENERSYEVGKFVGTHLFANRIADKFAPQISVKMKQLHEAMKSEFKNE